MSDPLMEAMLRDARDKLLAAVADGRVRVMRGEQMLTPEEAHTALLNNDPFVAVSSQDVMRAFPPPKASQ